MQNLALSALIGIGLVLAVAFNAASACDANAAPNVNVCDGQDFSSSGSVVAGPPGNFGLGGHYAHCNYWNRINSAFALTDVLLKPVNVSGLGFDIVAISACVAFPTGTEAAVALEFGGRRTEIPLTRQGGSATQDYYSGTIPTYLRVDQPGAVVVRFSNPNSEAVVRLDLFGVSYKR